MSYFYRLTIQYDGSQFYGWQKQSSASEPTIQGEIEKALEKITNRQLVNTIGSGRTDAGVHALGQVLRVETQSPMELSRLINGGNALLPPAIKILEAQEVSSDFHPIFSAHSKEYIYLFAETISPFERHRIAMSPRDLDIEAMRAGCELLVGEHDFVNFFCTGTPVKSTIRTIYSAELLPLPAHSFLHTTDVWQISFCGSGFLKQMVRLLIGALWQLGQGKISLVDLEDTLDARRIGKLGAVAPAHGLYLKEVHY